MSDGKIWDRAEQDEKVSDRAEPDKWGRIRVWRKNNGTESNGSAVSGKWVHFAGYRQIRANEYPILCEK